MTDRDLIQNLKRIASAHPETRKHLVPLLKQANAGSGAALIESVKAVAQKGATPSDFKDLLHDLAAFLAVVPNEDDDVDKALDVVVKAVKSAIPKLK